MRIEKISSDDYRVHLASQGSWVETATMIYLDQPVGTGFSYGIPIVDNIDEAAEEFLTFLNNLFNMYTDFPNREMFITGESYGGVYIPAFSWQILQENKKLGTNRYNLKSSMIGDPYVSLIPQRVT